MTCQQSIGSAAQRASKCRQGSLLYNSLAARRCAVPRTAAREQLLASGVARPPHSRVQCISRSSENAPSASQPSTSGREDEATPLVLNNTTSDIRWRRCQREAAAFRKALSSGLPRVDWSRYHLQLLFVDRTDTVRARTAVGLFETLANWNGYGRGLYAMPCGVDATAEESGEISTTVALMRRAEGLKLSPKLYAKAKESFTREDLDRFDLVIALDSSIKAKIMAAVGSAPEDVAYYSPRVVLLTAFSGYCGDDLLRTGGTAVLDPDLRKLTPAMAEAARQVTDIQTPLLSSPGDEEWATLVNTLIVCCAGLVQYLIDAYPPDLQSYDPV